MNIDISMTPFVDFDLFSQTRSDSPHCIPRLNEKKKAKSLNPSPNPSISTQPWPGSQAAGDKTRLLQIAGHPPPESTGSMMTAFALKAADQRLAVVGRRTGAEKT